MSDDPEVEGPQVLDYGVEKPRVLHRRDASEYYREPPAISRISTGDAVIWIVSFLVLLGLLLWLVNRWWDTWR